MLRSLVGSEMCIRDRYQRRVRDEALVVMSFGSSTSPRFKVASPLAPGPGAYHKASMRSKCAPPPPGSFSRAGWLQGSMECDRHNGLNREGFLGNQKAIETPGPGQYECSDGFRRGRPVKEAAFGSESQRFSGVRASGDTPFRGHEAWARDQGARGPHGFNVSSPSGKDAWLRGEVKDQYAVRPAGYQSRQMVSDTPGPGSYDGHSYYTGSTRAAGVPKSERFACAMPNTQVGPGSYYRMDMRGRTPTPAATSVNRSLWLHGEAGGHAPISGSHSQHVSREHLIDTPGPGAYDQRTSFSRAMSRAQHQITLEERMARGNI
eukprot:TRINITY_DN27032_c0_g1_i1.p1 TRINITY_DN27032_c0_g1~~TRINITY_DN27032_c0_g1_i1.p1  ORF type:complete len:320 (+),score=44.24 TRINITY_DN27032_c0_g1_i1:156-1115(+)